MEGDTDKAALPAKIKRARSGRTGLQVKVSITGLRETLKKFRDLPKDANTQLRQASLEIATDVARTARMAAVAAGSQAALMAVTVKPTKDRVPAVQAGGTRRVGKGRTRTSAGNLLFGSEFGMDMHSGWYARAAYDRSPAYQYHPHTGQHGAWFFPSVEGSQSEIDRRWNAAADSIVDHFSEDG